MKAYGCGRGRIHRELQPIYDPEAKKAAKKPVTKRYGVIVTDLETGEVNEFERIGLAADFIGCDTRGISERLLGRITSPLLGRYTFSRPGGRKDK